MSFRPRYFTSDAATHDHETNALNDKMLEQYSRGFAAGRAISRDSLPGGPQQPRAPGPQPPAQKKGLSFGGREYAEGEQFEQDGKRFTVRRNSNDELEAMPDDHLNEADVQALKSLAALAPQIVSMLDKPQPDGDRSVTGDSEARPGDRAYDAYRGKVTPIRSTDSEGPRLGDRAYDAYRGGGDAA